MPVVPFHGLVHAVDVAVVGRMGLYADGAVPDLGGCLIESVLAAAGDVDQRALIRELLGNAESDTGAAAGHDRDFALQLSACWCRRPWFDLLAQLHRHGTPRWAGFGLRVTWPFPLRRGIQ